MFGVEVYAKQLDFSGSFSGTKEVQYNKVDGNVLWGFLLIVCFREKEHWAESEERKDYFKKNMDIFLLQ